MSVPSSFSADTLWSLSDLSLCWTLYEETKDTALSLQCQNPVQESKHPTCHSTEMLVKFCQGRISDRLQGIWLLVSPSITWLWCYISSDGLGYIEITNNPQICVAYNQKASVLSHTLCSSQADRCSPLHPISWMGPGLMSSHRATQRGGGRTETHWLLNGPEVTHTISPFTVLSKRSPVMVKTGSRG